MAHRRKPLAIALGLNTAVLVAEIAGGISANSLSLVMDGVHNVSDEAGLVLLLVAYWMHAGLSGRFIRLANIFNSLGLMTVCTFLVWQTLERLTRPVPVLGIVPVIAGLIGAAGNWGVARVLRAHAQHDTAIRLAYVHNLSDTLLSLAPVAAGTLVLATGRSLFDPMIALLIAGFIIVTTVGSIAGSHKELLWPENVVCGHRDEVGTPEAN
jgi:cation diffusion facilitator family transporter